MYTVPNLTKIYVKKENVILTVRNDKINLDYLSSTKAWALFFFVKTCFIQGFVL